MAEIDNERFQSDMPDVDLNKQCIGGKDGIQIVKEQEISRDQIIETSGKYKSDISKQDKKENESTILEAVNLTKNNQHCLDNHGHFTATDKHIKGNENSEINFDNCHDQKVSYQDLSAKSDHETSYEKAEIYAGSDSVCDKELVKPSLEFTYDPIEKVEVVNSASGSDFLITVGLESDMLTSHLVMSTNMEKMNDTDIESMVRVIAEADGKTEVKVNQLDRKSEVKVSESDAKTWGKINEAAIMNEESSFIASNQSGDCDEEGGEKCFESKRETRFPMTLVSSEFGDKMGKFITDFVGNVYIAYKGYRGCSNNFCLQVVFMLLMVCQQFDPEPIRSGSVMFGHFHSISHNSIQESTVLAVVENNSAAGAMNVYEINLPEPDLPHTMINNNLARTFGINLRPNSENTIMSEYIETRMDNSQHRENPCTSTRGHQSNNEIHSSSEFISISSLPLAITVREADTGLQQNERFTRIAGVPALPCTNRLNLDEGITNRKVTEQVQDNLTNTNVAQTRLSQDGVPSTATTNQRARTCDIQTVGRYTFETIAEHTSLHLSDSVSVLPAEHTNDDIVDQEESMSDVLARARTFNGRWPHQHLDPQHMANAGLYFTGDTDIARCFDCDVCLGEWKAGDSPYTEHLRWSPECAFIQNLLHENPQYFGASGRNYETGNNNLVQTEEIGENGEDLLWSFNQGEQNIRLDIEISQTYSGHGHRQQNTDHGLLYPHGEHGGNNDRNNSEMILAPYRDTVYSAIQVSEDSHTGLTMFTQPLNFNDFTDQDLDENDLHDIDGQEQSPLDAIDNDMDFYHGSEAVRMVISEGYSQREVNLAIDAILTEDGIITVNTLKYMLKYLGFNLRP